jgi:hypothetical protein
MDDTRQSLLLRIGDEVSLEAVIFYVLEGQ